MAGLDEAGPGLVIATSPVRRRLYAYDATGGEGHEPLAVLYPRTAADVVAAIAWARQRDLAVVARGAGTGLSGGAVPGEGAVVLSTERMNRVMRIDPAAKRADVLAGLVNGALEPLLAPHGLLYAPDPASHRISTIGGNIAENSGGPHALKYGITGLHVRAVSVVDAAGRLGTFTAGATQPGCDLVSLVVGSEGTLGIVTQASLNLVERPAAIETALVSFADMAAATDFVSAIIARGMLPATCEFMDRPTIEAVEAWGVASYPAGAAAVLIVEFDGSAGEVADGIAALREAAGEHAAIGVEVAADPSARDRLWLGRRGAYAAVARHQRRLLTQDVTVPRQRLTAMLEAVGAIARRHRLLVATVGHAGDGNLHPDFPYDPDDADQSARVHAANVEVMRACVALDGSITGEHGIGTDKLDHLSLMYGPVELGLMAAVKDALDPGGMMNPGKAVPAAARRLPAGQGKPHAVPRDAAQVKEAVLAARSRRVALEVALDGLRGVSVDEANLTVEVGAGEGLAEVRQHLSARGLALPVFPVIDDGVGRALLGNDAGEGAWREQLLAATYVTGAGEVVRMGRPVMKNVAGYDLFRLLIGSRGRFGVPVKFTFRLRPGAMGEPDELRAARLAVQEGGLHGLLDLTVPPRALDRVLAEAGQATLAALPAVGRLFFRMDEREARLLALRAMRHGSVRAVWCGRRLLPAEGLERAWEEALTGVFDPDRVLGSWFAGGAS